MPSVKPAVVQLKVPKNQKLYNSFVIIFQKKRVQLKMKNFCSYFAI